MCVHGNWRNQLKKITLHRLTYIQWSPNTIYWWNHKFHLHQRQKAACKPIQSLTYIRLLYNYWEFCSNKAVGFNGPHNIYKLVNVQWCITTIQYLHWNITMFSSKGVVTEAPALTLVHIIFSVEERKIQCYSDL
jgi:hypothetical protein